MGVNALYRVGAHSGGSIARKEHSIPAWAENALSAFFRAVGGHVELALGLLPPRAKPSMRQQKLQAMNRKARRLWRGDEVDRYCMGCQSP